LLPNNYDENVPAVMRICNEEIELLKGVTEYFDLMHYREYLWAEMK